MTGDKFEIPPRAQRQRALSQLTFSLLIFALLGSSSLLAQPVNDDCSGATIIQEGVYPFDNSTATSSSIPTDPSQCLGSFLSSAEMDLWFSFTPKENGFAEFTTCPAGFDTDLVIYTGTCSDLLQVGCNGDACFGFGSTVSNLDVDADTEYLIRIGGFNGTTGNADLTLSFTPAIDPEDCTTAGDEDMDGLADCADPDCSSTPICASDECSGATNVVVGTISFDNSLASSSPESALLSNCDASGGFADLWFSFTAPANGYAFFSTCPGENSTLDTDLFIYTGSCNTLNQIGCDGDGCGSGTDQRGSQIDNLPVFGGQQYLIRIGGFNGARGSGLLEIQFALAGDDCSVALPAALGNNPVDNTLMTDSPLSIPLPNPDQCTGSELGSVTKDVWYSYTAIESGLATFSTCNSINFDSDLIVYTGDCDSLVQIACNGDSASCGNGTSSIENMFISAGSTYMIRLGSWQGGSGTGQLTISYSGFIPEDCTLDGDEDLDGLADCADPDCITAATCLEMGNCFDGIDNDSDGLTDCADNECDFEPACLSCPTLLSQNLDPGTAATIIEVCAHQPEHTENELLRSFDTSFYNCPQGIRVLAINVGIATAISASGSGQPASIRIYHDLDGADPDEQMLLLHEELFDVTDDMAGTIQTIALTNPVSLPYGAQLVVGFWIADSGGAGSGNILRPGGNIAGQTKPTWLVATECDIYYTTLDVIGLEEQFLLTVEIDDQGSALAGDHCLSAIPVSTGQTAFEITPLTNSPEPWNGNCSGLSITKDAWFRFTAATAGSLVVTSCNTVNFDSVIEIYTGDCNNLKVVASSCDGTGCSNGSGPTEEFPIEKDQTYRIRIGAINSTNGSGTFQIDFIPPPPIMNEIRIDQPGDDSDEYIELKGLPQSLDGLWILAIGDDDQDSSGVVETALDLTGATIGLQPYFVIAEDSLTIGDIDWSAGNDGLNLENEDNVTILLVENFSGSSGDDLDLDDDGVLDSTPWSQLIDSIAVITDPIDAGTGQPQQGNWIYSTDFVGPEGVSSPGHIERCPDSLGQFTIGSFDLFGGSDTPGLANNCTGAPSNDDCLNSLPIGEGVHVLDTLQSTPSLPEWDPNCSDGIGGFMASDVWFSYSPTAHGKLDISTCDLAGWDTDLAFYRGTCSSLEQVSCSGDASGSASGSGGTCQQWYSRLQNLTVFAGETYLIRVGGWEAGEEGIATLTVSLAISGDSPCDPVVVSTGTTPINNTLHGDSGIESDPLGCAGTDLAVTGPDVWCSYTPSANCTLTVNTCDPTGFGTQLVVYSGSCISLNATHQIACNGNATGLPDCQDLYSSVTLEAIGGTPYLIRISGQNASTGTSLLNIACSSSEPLTEPLANFSVTGAAPMSVMFRNVILQDSSDAGGDPEATIEIDWGDGEIESLLPVGSSVAHLYQIAPGATSGFTATPTLLIQNGLGSDQATGDSMAFVLIGDANLDGQVNIADVITLLNYLFQGQGPLPCFAAGDINGDNAIDIADAIYGLNYIFAGGLPPVSPSQPDCE